MSGERAGNSQTISRAIGGMSVDLARESGTGEDGKKVVLPEQGAK